MSLLATTRGGEVREGRQEGSKARRKEAGKEEGGKEREGKSGLALDPDDWIGYHIYNRIGTHGLPRCKHIGIYGSLHRGS